MYNSTRRRLMMGQTPSLPPGYKRVEYIESTGTQYIDLGVNFSFPLYLTANFKITQATQNTPAYMGGCYVYNSSVYRFWVASLPYQNGRTISNCGWVNNALSTQNVPINQDLVLKVEFRDGYQSLTINGVIYSYATNTGNTYGENYPILIGKGMNYRPPNNTTAQPILKARYGEVELQLPNQNFKLIPVRDTNFYGYLYDAIGGQIYGDAAGGHFLVGNDV